jgi:hypothetical protein
VYPGIVSSARSSGSVSSEVRQQGNYVILKKLSADGAVGCVVPRHKECEIGTLKSILKQAHVDVDEFIRNP